MKEYKETHQQGLISIENLPWDIESPGKMLKGDFGIQIAADGRIWVCIDGVAFIRFKPYPRKEKKNGTNYARGQSR